MAPEDRDRSFDKALSRHLRGAAHSGVAADARGGAASRSASCLDAEMLAAYHERSLLPEEMNAAKEHIVDCEHCQTILAQLEMTDSIPLATVETEKDIAPAAATASAEKPRPPILIRGPRWGWLVPAGALAASLLMWIAFHEGHRPSLVSHDNEVKMARVQEPPAPAPTATRQAAGAPSANETKTLSENSRVAGGDVNGAVSHEMDAAKQQREEGSRARVAAVLKSPARLEGKEKERRKDALRDSYDAPQLVEKGRADLDDKKVTAPQLSEQNQVQAQNIQTQNQMNTQKVLGPAPLGQMTSSKKAKPESAAMNRAAAPPPAPEPPPSAQVAGFAASTASTALESAAMVNPHLIAARGTGLIWRAGRAGLIEYSTDNGATWSRQISGVLTDLTTGTAPSPSVCWIVGRVGTILLTVDAGAHWVILHSPLSEDLGGVRAVDALHATIWNVRNTKSFETTDGGVTWKPVPAP